MELGASSWASRARRWWYSSAVMPGVTVALSQHSSRPTLGGPTFPGLQQMGVRLIQRLAESELGGGCTRICLSPRRRSASPPHPRRAGQSKEKTHSNSNMHGRRMCAGTGRCAHSNTNSPGRESCACRESILCRQATSYRLDGALMLSIRAPSYRLAFPGQGCTSASRGLLLPGLLACTAHI